jgi:hypothetical protein
MRASKMSVKEDRPKPENFIWESGKTFKPEQYLEHIGRGNVTSREKTDTDSIRELIRHPKAQPFDAILAKWHTEPDMAEYPHAPGVKFRSAVNKISPRPYDTIISNGDSYFSASK